MIILIIVAGFLIINVALGLFGVLWYNINLRKSEIGLRRAVGASGNAVSKQLVGEALVLATFALIIGSFFAIHEITGDVILRILLGVASPFIIIFYTIIYDKGFQVSQNFTQIKNRFQPLIRKSNFRKAEMKRAIIGIRSLGIQVGSFHTLERQSTLIFLDFILKQIVGLLITFS